MAPLAPKPAFGGMSGRSAQLHHDVYGRACIDIHGYSEPQKTNTDIFNHMLLIANGCSMLIKLHVCYYQSEHCIDVVARAVRENARDARHLSAHAGFPLGILRKLQLAERRPSGDRASAWATNAALSSSCRALWRRSP